MKISRLIQIAIYAFVIMFVGSMISHALFGNGGGRTCQMPYGNLSVSYSIHKQGILGQKVDWLIAMPEIPKNQSYQGDTGLLTYAFENGKEFSFRPNSKYLIWVDPAFGPIQVTADLNEDLIQRIDRKEQYANGKNFSSGQDFLAWVLAPNKE